MDSSMCVCGVRPDRRHGPGSPARVVIRRPGPLMRALGLMLLLSPLPVTTAAEPSPFELPGVTVRLADEVYRLDAIARLQLTPAVEDALHNGVDLTLAWEVSIERKRAWWLNADVAHIVQHYRLSFHELTRQYIVTNLNTGQSSNYTRIRTALDQIGRLIDFPLVDRVLVADGGGLIGNVRIRLRHDELPLPLRAVALFDDDWDLASEWYQWQFE